MSEMSIRSVRFLAGLVLAFAVGFMVFGVFFSDGGEDGSLWKLYVAAVVLQVIGGGLIGYLRPSMWVWLSALSAWGGVVLGSVGIVMGQRHAALTLLLPLGAAFLGGYIGSRWFARAHSAGNAGNV